MTCRRKEVLLSGHPRNNLRIKTSLLLLLVGTSKPPLLSLTKEVFSLAHDVFLVQWKSPGAPARLAIPHWCFFCVLPIPQTALAPSAECLRPWLVPMLPWFAKLSSCLESHLSINKLPATIKARIATDSKYWHSRSHLDGFKHHCPFFPCLPLLPPASKQNPARSSPGSQPSPSLD